MTIKHRGYYALAFASNKELDVDNLTVTHKAVSTSAAPATVIAGVTAKKHNVYGMAVTSAGTVKATFYSKVATTNTAIRSFNLIAGVPVVLPVGKNGDEWFATGTAGALTVGLSAPADVNITTKTKSEA